MPGHHIDHITQYTSSKTVAPELGYSSGATGTDVVLNVKCMKTINLHLFTGATGATYKVMGSVDGNGAEFDLTVIGETAQAGSTSASYDIDGLYTYLNVSSKVSTGAELVVKLIASTN